MITENNNLSLEEQVFRTLEEEIISGVYAAGESLTELGLSAKLGVSRTPVRSALHRLAEDGLVSIAPNRGAMVVGVTLDDLIDTYKIRIRLEGLASRMATERLTPKDKSELTNAVELAEFYVSKEDTEHLKELDTVFHGIIYRASGNRMLSKILGELHRNIRAYRKKSLEVPGRLKQSVREHREILDAMLAGDANRADELTSKHIESAMENLIAMSGK